MSGDDDLVNALGSADPNPMLSSPFGSDTPTYRVKQVQTKGGGTAKARDFPFDLHHKVFVTYVPWYVCGGCKKALEEKTIEHPEEGVLVCPHTDHKAYEELLRKNAHEGVRILDKSLTTLKNGSVQIAVHYAVPVAAPPPKPQDPGRRRRL
jgi:hypothetical protein